MNDLAKAATQALWHLGTDDDRTAMAQADKWATSREEAADLLRAALSAPCPETDLLETLTLILPLAKGYRPEGQTDTARRTCNSWIEAAEEAIAKAEEGAG